MTRTMRLLSALAALVMIAALAAGCAANNAASIKPQEDENKAATDVESPPSSESSEENAAPGAGSLPLLDPGNAASSGKKIIYSADMTIEAKNAAAAITAITAKAVELNGYVSNSQYVEESRNASSSITIRIPPEKYKELTEYVGTLGKVLSLSLGSQDITDQYYDIQSRLKNARAQEAQLLEIMKQAVKIEDILKVRSELNAVQEEIEVYQGQLRLMDNQVGYSTVVITIQQPAAPAVVVDDTDTGVKFWGFEAVWQKIARGFTDGFNWTLNAISGILMVLSYLLFPLVLVAAVVFVIILIVKLAIKRKKKG